MNDEDLTNGAMTPIPARPHTPDNAHEAVVEVIGGQHKAIRELELALAETRSELYGTRRRCDRLVEALSNAQAEHNDLLRRFADAEAELAMHTHDHVTGG